MFLDNSFISPIPYPHPPLSHPPLTPWEEPGPFGRPFIPGNGAETMMEVVKEWFTPGFVEALPTVADLRPRGLHRETLPLSHLHFHDSRQIFTGNRRSTMTAWAFRQVMRDVGLKVSLGCWIDPPNKIGNWTQLEEEYVPTVNKLLNDSADIRNLVSERTPSGQDSIRSFLDPQHPPLFEGDLLQELHRHGHVRAGSLRVVRLETTASSTHLILVDPRGTDLGTEKQPDPFHPGLYLYSTGTRPGVLSIGKIWYREACRNSLTLSEREEPVAVATDNRMSDRALAKVLAQTFADWDTHANEEREDLEKAQATRLNERTVRAALDQASVPELLARHCLSMAMCLPRTSLSAAQAIAYVAHAKNADPDIRRRLERAAGTLIAKEESLPT